MNIEQKLITLGITLPAATPPLANYVPTVISGNIVSIAGQLPMEAMRLSYTGKVGLDIDNDTAAKAARLCAINIIAQIKSACSGDLERVVRIIKLGGFINCIDTFTDHPTIINGASALMVDVFGEKGRHSRSAVGVTSLPLGAPVEIDALVEIR